MQGYHDSVLLREALEALRVEKGKWYLDATLGDGGHSLGILKLGGKVVGVDVDPTAIERAKARLEKEDFDEQNFILIQSNFRDIENQIQQPPIKSGQTDTDQKFAGAIFDLGVSSLQLTDPERGFSFTKEGPLDMRMDPTLEVKALDLINIGGRKELYELFNKLGEEKHAKTISGAIVSAREVRKIATTRDLAGIVEKVLGSPRSLPRASGDAGRGKAGAGGAGRRDKIHPATRIFQALRIAVNDELAALEEGLEKVRGKIEKNGHIIVISFHSLEDRIVKITFRKWADGGLGKILTDKPVVPTEQEVSANPRSRSAKMRVFELEI